MTTAEQAASIGQAVDQAAVIRGVRSSIRSLRDGNGCCCVLCESHRATRMIAEGFKRLEAAEEVRLCWEQDREGNEAYLRSEVEAVVRLRRSWLVRRRLRAVLKLTQGTDLPRIEGDK